MVMTQAISVVIRKADDSIAATIGTINVSTITTSDALYTFTNTSNTYKLQAGDKLLLEHTGGTGTDCIMLKRTDSDSFDKENTHGVTFS